jgi:hypothetical protein
MKARNEIGQGGMVLFSLLALIVLLGVGVALTLLNESAREAVLGEAFEASVQAEPTGRRGFEATLAVPCNRWFDRVVGLRLDPPIEIVRPAEAFFAVAGEVQISIDDGVETTTRQLDLEELGSSVTEAGVSGKRLMSYGAAGLFCAEDQTITVQGSGLSFSPRQHEVTVYVRSERPAWLR